MDYFCFAHRSGLTTVSYTPVGVFWSAPYKPLMLVCTSAWLRSTPASPALSSGSRCSSSHTDSWKQSPGRARSLWWCYVTPGNPASATRTTWDWWAPLLSRWRSTVIPSGWRKDRQGHVGEGWESANGNTYRKWRRAETGDTIEKSDAEKVERSWDEHHCVVRKKMQLRAAKTAVTDGPTRKENVR